MPKKRDYSSWEKKELIKRIEALEKRKKYGLVWDEESTREEFEEASRGKLPVLVEEEERAIDAGGEGPTHIMIEGDNYHALSVLNYTHEGKVDVIYIDPPYNTGAKDWKYNNNFVDDNDAFRHSKWLSFMNNRLVLAKDLLHKNGVLICTIDENEHATLGLLLQELFLEYEIVCITIIHNPGGIQGKNFSYCHEYAYFIFPKNGLFISKKNRDNVPPTPLRDWGKESSKREAAKNCFYPFIVKENKIIEIGEVCPDDFHPIKSNLVRKDKSVVIYPIDKKGVERKWRFSRQSVEAIKDELFCKEIKGEYVILRKKQDYRWKTVWDDTKYNANIYGTQLLNKIIRKEFPYPKSLYAVMDCIKAIIHDKGGAVILDFFAGSGTTGHAVMELNKEDGGQRQFILCTNNENGIAEEVCSPRVRKVMEGYRSARGQDVEGLGGKLRYFRTDFVPDEQTDANKKRITERATAMLCLREGTFEKVEGTEEWQIFKNGEKHTAILYAPEAILNFRERIEAIEGVVSIYVFSLSNETHAEAFAGLEGRATLCAVPESILKVYRRIYG